MFCPNCGSNLQDDSKFCASCGSPLKPTASQDMNSNESGSYRPNSNPSGFSQSDAYQTNRYSPEIVMRKPKKSIFKRWWFWVIAVIVVIVVAANLGSDGSEDASGSAATAQSPSNATSAPAQTPAQTPEPAPTEKPKTEYTVGDAVTMNDVVVTLQNVTVSTGSSYYTPTAGNEFVIFEFIIENDSSSDLAISSIMSFEAYADDYALNFSLTAQLASDKTQLDGSVAAGKKMAGAIGYEVPTGWEELEVRFSPSVWSSKEITFVVTKDQA